MKWCAIIIFLMVHFICIGQNIRGVVFDADTKEPVPFASVCMKGTTNGILTDSVGQFVLTNVEYGIISVSCIGYNPTEIPYNTNKKVEFSIPLKTEVSQIDEVTVKPEIPRAKVLLKKIRENKRENADNIESVGNYKQLENTTVFIAVDTTSNIKKMFDNMEDITMSLDGQELQFSPVYLKEEMKSVSGGESKSEYNKREGIFPRLNDVFESVILMNVIVDLDFYKEQVNIMDRGFVSPLSSTGGLHYNYYLNDSTIKNDRKYFNFSFVPKNQHNPLFTGHFTVEDSTFALTDIDAFISEKANINFINGFKANVSYLKQPDGKWFYNKQDIKLNLALSLNKDSISKYSSERVDNITKGNWLINKTTLYSTSDRLDEVKPEEWYQQPEFQVAMSLDTAYKKVGVLKNQKIVKGIDAIGGMAMSSFLNVGKIDIGPVFDIYSTNKIEGTRLTVPLRTSEKMWKYFSVGGFLGAGNKTKELKYGANVIWQPAPEDRLILRMRYSNDYNLVSQDKYLRFVKYNPNNKGNGNFIAAFTTWEKNPYLKEEQLFEMRAEYNFASGSHFEINPYYSSVTETPYVTFIKDGTPVHSYNNIGVLLNYRLTFGQNYDKYYFERVYYINKIPVINFSCDMGKIQLPDGNFNDYGLYCQFQTSIHGRVTRGAVFMNYMLNGGYLFGDAPYDFLDQPVGSMSYGYAKYRFNLLHHASFAHNLYTNFHMHINGGGILLNRIPFIKELKLREIVSLKCHWGTLENGYKGVFSLPDYYTKDDKEPYAEIGLGLTNILKVIRVEYVHLLGSHYAGCDFADRSGIRFRTEMSF